MARDAEKAREARRRYVLDRQQLPTIAIGIGVSVPTVRRWKAAAREVGDDWDAARAAATVSGEGFDALIISVVEDYVVQHQSTIEELKAAQLAPAEKAKVLAALADSFNKTVKAAGRMSPKISELGVAMDVLQRLGDFVHESFPQHAGAFLEILEPFGERIAAEYR